MSKPNYGMESGKITKIKRGKVFYEIDNVEEYLAQEPRMFIVVNEVTK